MDKELSMNTIVLPFIVIAEIVVFQFATSAFTHSLFAALLRQPDGSVLPQSVPYLRRARRWRFSLGGALLLVAVATGFGIPADPGMRKLVLLVVSLLSSAVFVQSSLQDRRTLRSMRATLPEASVRRASLQPRSVDDWYNVAWEGLPIAILLATVIATVALGQRIGNITTGMWVLLLIQIAFVVGTLAYTIRGNPGAPDVSRRIPGFEGSPEKAVAFGVQLVSIEMKYFMAAKVSVTLLLGVGLVENGLSQLAEAAASWFVVASWVLVVLLLLLFTAFVSRIMLLVRRVH
jgi:hypothetical protein